MRAALVLTVLAASACTPTDPDLADWQARASRVTIIRDDWGIAHVHGPSDADAVFGMMYAQAEDDFNRVETNFINAMGRLAEAEGERAIWQDLRMKLFIDTLDLQAMYGESPAWLRELMDAWAAGLNFWMHEHPEVTPRVIRRFAPWMALAFSEGSIGGDIERVNLRRLEEFYGTAPERLATAHTADPPPFVEPSGSNGIAIAPANTAAGHALLLINPHTSFFFRAETHVSSDAGLNAYGAVTWGQFFIYQGFNESAGWMHTSSGVDNVDEYAERVVERDGRYYYRYGNEERPVIAEQIAVPFRTDTGMAQRAFTVYRTHHGPVVRQADGRWITVRLMEEPLKALEQSYRRTRARNLDEFLEVMRLHTNSSNNTVFADASGNIAYLHANFIPRRDPRFDWTRPVDGSDPATEWGDPLAIEDSPNAINPATGWVQNTNNWPYTAAGSRSPRRADYPAYVQVGGENPRGLHAVRLLEGRTGFTLEGLREAAFDPYLTWFEDMLPPLLAAWERAPGGRLKTRLAEPIAALRAWDLHWGVASVPTSLGVFWGEELQRATRNETPVTDQLRLEALDAAVTRLERDFGSWRTPWGDINRFQRLTDELDHPFDDDGPSIPVGFTSSRWGSLASFGARPEDGSRKYYGTSGNSFVAVVEFGDSVRARAVTAGGESGDPSSPHFNDQAERYATGNLRPVYFYPHQLEGHTERTYHPGR